MPSNKFPTAPLPTAMDYESTFSVKLKVLSNFSSNACSLYYSWLDSEVPVRLLTRSSTLELFESVLEISIISVVKGNPPLI